MGLFQVRNVKLKGLTACVPIDVEENRHLAIFKGEEASTFIKSTGIERRRITNSRTTTSDLCFHAAEQLLIDLKWQKGEIDCLIFVSQTPDYILPATSCILQDRLGLSKECYSLDLSMGCSGWIYGSSVITSLMQTGSLKKGLLMVGDSVSKFCSRLDKSAWPLFGDAGTVSAFEYQRDDPGFMFHMATDGAGYDAILIQDGGFRVPFNNQSLDLEAKDDGNSRNRIQLMMNGMDVFAFGISKGPDSISQLLQYFQIDKESVDAFIFHQANLFMNEKIRGKLKLPLDKTPYSLKNYGNTSSASIPLTLITECREKLTTKNQKLIACGFGVGLSWGSVYFETNRIVCSDLIEI